MQTPPLAVARTMEVSGVIGRLTDIHIFAYRKRSYNGSSSVPMLQQALTFSLHQYQFPEIILIEYLGNVLPVMAASPCALFPLLRCRYCPSNLPSWFTQDSRPFPGAPYEVLAGPIRIRRQVSLKIPCPSSRVRAHLPDWTKLSRHL